MPSLSINCCLAARGTRGQGVADYIVSQHHLRGMRRHPRSKHTLTGLTLFLRKLRQAACTLFLACTSFSKTCAVPDLHGKRQTRELSVQGRDIVAMGRRAEGHLELEVGVLAAGHFVVVHVRGRASQVRLEWRVQGPRLHTPARAQMWFHTSGHMMAS